MMPAIGITGEHNNQGITIEDEKENELVKGIEMEQHTAVTDNPSDVSTVYWRMVQEATNGDQTLSKVKDILQ